MTPFRSTVLISAAFLLLFCINYGESATFIFNLTDGTQLEEEDALYDEEVQSFSSKHSINLNTKICPTIPISDEKLRIHPTYKRYYQFGNKRYEDHKLGEDHQYYTYDTPQYLQIVLRYPKNGNWGPAAVTYLYLAVEAENTNGNAFISEGGLGQHVIAVSVFVYDTRVFAWTSSVYGY